MSFGSMYHLPPPREPPPPPPHRVRALLLITTCVLAGAVGLAGLILFAAGEDLFGSDDATIDTYNQEVLQSCETPGDWTLVRSYIFVDTDSNGDEARTMSYIWASPQPPGDVAAHYGVDGPGIWALASADRSCKFAQRPSVLVLGLWSPDQAEPLDRATQTPGFPVPDDDEFWGGPGADITDIATVPHNTRSFVRLRLGQHIVEGLLGMAPAHTRT